MSNGSEALDYLHVYHVDVVLMDVHMPIMDGPSALTRIKTEHPRVRVLFMASLDDEENDKGVVYRLLSGGARGYLLKDSSPEEIRAAVRSVLDGGVPVSPVVSARILNRLLPQHQKRARDFGLSDREREVLELLCRADSNRSIARQLRLSESTVKSYVSSIMRKMDCSSRVHIVVTAFECGLVPDVH